MIAKTKKIEDIKTLTKYLPSVRYTDPDYVYLSITNARCATGECYVKEGDKVLLGQVIGMRKGPFFEQPIHSTVSGTVVGIVKKFEFVSLAQLV